METEGHPDLIQDLIQNILNDSRAVRQKVKNVKLNLKFI